MRHALLACLIATSAGAPAAAGTYIALGDSITFGETDLNYVKSDGDRGYVALLADKIAAANGTPRDTVVNLAIDGETAASFFTNAGRTAPVNGRGDAPLQLENTHYPDTSRSQSMVFASAVAAATSPVDTVSITLGFNELAALSTLPPATALADIPSTLATYKSNYSAVLDQVRSLAPNAHLYLLGYYNPFPADPTSPAAPIFNAGGVALNDTIASLASQYGATFVDPEPAFAGREAALTYLGVQPHGTVIGGDYGGVLPIGNVHPNAAGYAAIASTIPVGGGTGAVPEPAAWALLVAGFGLVGMAARRRGRTPVMLG